MFSILWYVLIGILLANGVPHFMAGSASKYFRSPFGRYSSPGLNTGWGLANFIVATLLVVWRITEQAPGRGQWIAMLIGFWLQIVLFGLTAKRFFDDRGTAVEPVKPVK